MKQASCYLLVRSRNRASLFSSGTCTLRVGGGAVCAPAAGLIATACCGCAADCRCGTCCVGCDPCPCGCSAVAVHGCRCCCFAQRCARSDGVRGEKNTLLRLPQATAAEECGRASC